jgi:transcription initiation factor TFIIB
LEEVGIAGNISKKESGRYYRVLIRRLDPRVPSVDPVNFVSRFMSRLALSGNAEIIALKILDQAIKLRLTIGRDPVGIAAAVTYIATRLTDEQRTQGEIAKQAHVTEVTIRNIYKEMIRKINFETKL